MGASGNLEAGAPDEAVAVEGEVGVFAVGVPFAGAAKVVLEGSGNGDDLRDGEALGGEGLGFGGGEEEKRGEGEKEEGEEAFHRRWDIRD